MSGETSITLIGNLVAVPELRYTSAGVAVCNFTVASTPRSFDKRTNEWVDGTPLFMRCSLWREAAENVTSSLAKGARVIVTGDLKVNNYTDKEDNKRTSIEMNVEEIGPSLRFAEATVRRATKADSAPASQQRGGQWSNDSDEPPF